MAKLAVETKLDRLAVETKLAKLALETKLAKLAVLTMPPPILVPPGVNPTIVEA